MLPLSLLATPRAPKPVSLPKPRVTPTADAGAASAAKLAKKMAGLSTAATNTYNSAKLAAGKRLTEATAATAAMTKSKDAATKAHSDYSAFVMAGHDQGYVH